VRFVKNSQPVEIERQWATD